MSGLNSHRHRKDRVSGQLAPLPRTSSYGSHHSHASGSGRDRPRDGETAPAAPPPTEERVNGGGGGGGGGGGDGSDAHWNIGRSKHTVAFPSDAHRPAAKLPALADDRHAAERKLLDDLLGPPGGRKKHGHAVGGDDHGHHGHHKHGHHKHGHHGKAEHGVARRKSHDVLRVGGKHGGGGSGGREASGGGGGDTDLITKMAARLAQLEKAQYHHRDEMVRKDREILKLKRKVQALEAASGGSDAAVSEIENLRSENLSLKQQVHEMETFLNDYGLVWVGGEGNSGGGGGSGGGKQEESSASPSADGAPKFRFDSHMLMERVKQLNAAAGEGKKEVAKVRGVHKFKHKESVKIAVYRDGILVRRGPFRSFRDKTARLFVQDLLDGYFPSEFKSVYPDGVVLNVEDKTSEDYDPSHFQPFSGKGAAIGDGGNRVHSLADVGGAEFQLGKKEFLNALPASVLKGGKVIKVRDGVEDMLSGGKQAEREQHSGDVVLVKTGVLADLAKKDESGRTVTPADIATLRVKSDTGRETLLLKLRYDDTIRDVHAAIDKHRTETAPYVLRTAVPRKAYTDLDQTLRDAGLVPNAKLFIAPAED